MVGLIRDDRRPTRRPRRQAYSSGDDFGDGTHGRSDDDDDMTERAIPEISPPRAGGWRCVLGARAADAHARSSLGARSPARSVRRRRRRGGVVAHQELVDGRVLVRCRAKRHVRLGTRGRPRRRALVARVEPSWTTGGGARRENSGDETAATLSLRTPPPRCLPHIHAVDRASRGARGLSGIRSAAWRISDWATTALSRTLPPRCIRRLAPSPVAMGACFSGAYVVETASPFDPTTSIVQRRRG